jgi:hypothetical protein
MPKVLILCPTFDHTETLFASTASARAQRFQDWELVVIGDGAPDRTREILSAITQEDPRIRYEAHPKSVRYGEIYRDQVIRDSHAEVVLQLGDDDLWAPDHIDRMLEVLGDADWANEAPLRLLPDGTAKWCPINHGRDSIRSSLVRGVPVSAGPNFVAYRREAYLRLPEGWTCAPPGNPSDFFMWAKFFRFPKLRVASTASTSAIKLPSHVHGRQHFDSCRRLAELQPWLARIAEPGMVRHLCADALIRFWIMRIYEIHAVPEDATWTEALRRCGFEPAAIHEAPRRSLNGDPMILPLSPQQQQEAELALQDYRQRHASKAGV